MSGYRPRRLRPPRGPRYVISSTVPIDAETAARVRDQWRTIVRRGHRDVVIDGTRFTVTELRP